MTLLAGQPVLCRLPPVIGGNGFNSKVSKVKMVHRQALPPLQVNEKEKSLLQDTCTNNSRREMMHLTAASLGFFSLLLPQSAKAGTVNANILQQFIEKLGQMAGFSKPKDDDEKNSNPKINETEGKPIDEDEKNSKPKIKETEEKNPKPISEDEKISKPKINETEEKNPKPRNEDEGKKTEPTTQQSTAAEKPDEEPSSSALPNLLNDTKTEETTLP